MKLTIAAQEMVQALDKVTSVNDLAAITGLAARAARDEWYPRITTFHIREAMEKLAEADPMAPDYDALAEVEPTSQIEDCRDSAEAVG